MCTTRGAAEPPGILDRELGESGRARPENTVGIPVAIFQAGSHCGRSVREDSFCYRHIPPIAVQKMARILCGNPVRN